MTTSNRVSGKSGISGIFSTGRGSDPGYRAPLLPQTSNDVFGQMERGQIDGVRGRRDVSLVRGGIGGVASVEPGLFVGAQLHRQAGADSFGDRVLERQQVAAGEIQMPDRELPPERWDTRRRWRREVPGPDPGGQLRAEGGRRGPDAHPPGAARMSSPASNCRDCRI